MHYVWILFGLAFALVSVVYAANLYQQIVERDAGDEKMQKIARAVQEGARAFLRAEYRWLAFFVAGVVLLMLLASLFGADGFGFAQAFPFFLGACASAIAGWFGVHTSTRAAVRTTQAAKTSLTLALDVAFKSGTVMALTVVGLGLGGIGVLLFVYSLWYGKENAAGIANLLAFSFGASSTALFARVGGGIYAKAAGAGADLVAKEEEGIAKDDPRNPATIAADVGDDVGDVAGMGADLFESYVGAVLATIVLSFTVAGTGEELGREIGALVAYPIVLAGLGIAASIYGTMRVRADSEADLGPAMFRGSSASSIALVAAMALFTLIIRPTPIDADGHRYGSLGVYGAMVIGLVLGVLIRKVTEYHTSEKMPPAQRIAEQSRTGPAANVIHGLATGMASTCVPVLLIALAIWICNAWAGVYGICIAAVGMLSTLGISLAVNAYGPVANNAGGLAQMADLPADVRKRTDALDATGNTTAAIGKGFAIGSAALTALALFHTYRAGAGIRMALDDAAVVIGLLLGAMLPFVFSSMAMRAVGRAAHDVVDEVRRQFREIPGLRDGTAPADHERCVRISTEGALRKLVAPGLLAILAPVLTGMLFGKAAAGGLLAGALASGVMLALFLANAGGAWDNAKKYVEAGAFGGKGSDVHEAAAIGDTVGAPCKDTAGPSIDILIKLMAIAAVLALPLFR
jgi:K(+)-stimulated pyrophosphate-energized sodium pump